MRTSFSLDDERKEKLRRLSEQTGASQAEIIRRAIDEYVDPRLQAEKKRTK